MMMNRDQTALRSALDAAHRARDARAAQAHIAKMAAKNLRDARKPTREELFAAQLEKYREEAEWRAGFERRRQDDEQAHENRMHRLLDEERMQRWRDAKSILPLT
jgi:hypothetical protein